MTLKSNLKKTFQYFYLNFSSKMRLCPSWYLTLASAFSPPSCSSSRSSCHRPTWPRSRGRGRGGSSSNGFKRTNSTLWYGSKDSQKIEIQFYKYSTHYYKICVRYVKNLKIFQAACSVTGFSIFTP